MVAGLAWGCGLTSLSRDLQCFTFPPFARAAPPEEPGRGGAAMVLHIGVRRPPNGPNLVLRHGTAR
jgi:hypothetical protein